MSIPILAAELAIDTAGATVADIVAAVRQFDLAGYDFVVVDDVGPAGSIAFEPFTLAASLVYATERIGIVLALGTGHLHGSYHPYHAARRLASLDHLSGGRIGWVLGGDPDPERAREYVNVARALWHSWEPGAFVRDTTAGRYYDPDLIHTPHFAGEHFRVRGPLNISPPPQGTIPIIHDVAYVHDEPDLGADVVVVGAPDRELWPAAGSAPVIVRATLAGGPLGVPLSRNLDETAALIDAWRAEAAVDGVLLRTSVEPADVIALGALGSHLGRTGETVSNTLREVVERAVSVATPETCLTPSPGVRPPGVRPA